MKSPNLWLGVGLLLMTVAMASNGPLWAAEKGYFKGIDLFYGDTEGRNLYMEGAPLEYFQGETYLRSNKAEIREKADGSREVIFQGEVLLIQEDLKVTGDQFCYNTEEEDGTFTGQVVLERIETRDEQGQVVKEGLTLVCGNLYLQTMEKAFIATEQPTIEHQDFRGRGQIISYRDDEEKLTISGGFQLWRKEDQLVGEKICFDLRKKTFEARRGADPLELHMEIEEKEKAGEDKPREEEPLGQNGKNGV